MSAMILSNDFQVTFDFCLFHRIQLFRAIVTPDFEPQQQAKMD